MGKQARELKAGDFSRPNWLIETVLQSDEQTVIVLVSDSLLTEPLVRQFHPDDETNFIEWSCPNCGEQVAFTQTRSDEEITDEQ